MTRQERYKQMLLEAAKKANEEAPAMSSGTGGFSSSAPAAGPVAGYDPVGFKQRIKRKAKQGLGPQGGGGVSATKQSSPKINIGDVTAGLV